MASVIDGRAADLSPAPIYPGCSTAAITIGGSGVVMFRLMAFASALILLGSGSFMVFAVEPLWSRLLTFVTLGLVPAVFSFVFGWSMYWVLRIAGAAYDPVAARLHVLAMSVARVTVRATCRTVDAGKLLATAANKLFEAGRDGAATPSGPSAGYLNRNYAIVRDVTLQVGRFLAARHAAGLRPVPVADFI